MRRFRQPQLRVAHQPDRRAQAWSAAATRSHHAHAPCPTPHIAHASTLTAWTASIPETVRAAGAYHRRAPLSRPSIGNPSTIDPNDVRKRRRLHPLAARRALLRRLHAHRGRRTTPQHGAQRGQQRPQKLRERPVSGGAVASGPGPERMQQGAVGGVDMAARGGLAHVYYIGSTR